FFPIERFLSPSIGSWIQFALGSIVVLWGGFPFFQRALSSVKNISPNMFTLIAMGTGAAWIYSTIALIFPQIFPASLRGQLVEVPLYFQAAAVTTTLALPAQVLEPRPR